VTGLLKSAQRRAAMGAAGRALCERSFDNRVQAGRLGELIAGTVRAFRR